MPYWIIKQEPAAYSWDTLVREKTTPWTGVRNFQARNHLRAMKKGDYALFYHSGEEKQLVGLTCVRREAFPDPTAAEGDWSAVEVQALKPLSRPLPLAQMKADPELATMAFVKQSRLSVCPLSEAHFKLIMELSGTRL